MSESILFIPEKKLDVISVEFLNPSPRLTSPKCTICHRPIGTGRPIALVQADGKSLRLCKSCIEYLEVREDK